MPLCHQPYVVPAWTGPGSAPPWSADALVEASTGDSTEARTTAASEATRPRRGRERATRGEVMARRPYVTTPVPRNPAVASQEKSLSAVVIVWKTPYASRMLTTAHDRTRRRCWCRRTRRTPPRPDGLALGLDIGLVRRHVLVELRRHRPDQQVGHEADPEDRHHGEQRRSVGVGGEGARTAGRVEEAVDDERSGHAGGRPGGQQPAVDRADLEDAEQVAEVRRDGREAAAVERDDDGGEEHEDRGGRRADQRQGDVQDDADAEVDHVDRLAADVVRGARPHEPAGHVEQRQQADEAAGGRNGDARVAARRGRSPGSSGWPARGCRCRR